MPYNTRLVFKSLLRRLRADCVCDIGSCDGADSLLFRQILPEAELVAFEANPILYKKMKANPALAAGRVAIFPYAITNARGTARFHVMDLDYEGPAGKNMGTSSLLVDETGRERETVEVETRRMDEFLPATCPGVRTVGLWIDAEGAEFEVLQGIAGIKDRVAAVHVETSFVAIRTGQKVYAEVKTLLNSYGFVALGNNMSKDRVWGDAVFVNQQRLAGLGFRFRFNHWIGRLSGWCRVDVAGLFLKKHCQPLYRPLWRMYMKLFTLSVKTGCIPGFKPHK